MNTRYPRPESGGVVAYRLERGESVRAGVTRVIVEELDGAAERLTAPSEDRVNAVHEARKHVKKARSALRLVRGELPGRAFARENDRLRQVARRMSGVRDAQVAVTALDRLRESGEGLVPPAVWDEVRRVLADRRQTAGEQLLGAGGFADEVTRDLGRARERLAGLTLERGGWKALRGGLAREYARGADARATAARKPGQDNLHAWRRRVKDAWYHLRLLQPAWPAPLGDVAEEAHRLSELLGDDHDLANLRATMTGEPGAFGVQLDGLVALLDERRGQLQARARLLGDRLYAESPGDYAARLGAYWRAWRSEDEIDPGANGQRDASGVTVDEPRLVAVAGTVEDSVVAAATPPRTPEPLLQAPPLGSVERPPSTPRAATTVAEPQLPRPEITTATPPGHKPAAVEADTVYVTTGGKRYHRGGCTLAGPNARPLSRTAAEEADLAPCRSCRP